MIREPAMNRLLWHQAKGHQCFLVTASLSFWTQDWAKQHHLTLISSKGKIVNGIFTGKLDGLNCWGKEKRRRVEALVDPDSIDIIYAYGDSQGDKEMLQWADRASFRLYR